MLLTHLYLRNFRVYEDELDLELPPGLVGIYGPNGAGKSTLLEAIVFTLWGRARTPKEEIRSAGVGADCVTELEFEHEGHLYLVRRNLTGVNSTVRAEAHCDGLMVSEGVRDTARYVHSVLGMDDAAFRASVFAEQKQLAAFSSQSPADRRRLVLQLLGITPLDAARDKARRDSRSISDQHQKLRGMLPDLASLALSAEDADARAAAAEAVAASEQSAAEATRRRLDEAAESLTRLDAVRQRHEALVIEGRAARDELDRARAEVAELIAELESLRGAAAELSRLSQEAAGLEATEERVRRLSVVLDAARAAASVVVPEEPLPPDDDGHKKLVEESQRARTALASAHGQRLAVTEELTRARQQADRSSRLSTEADCPLCGQALGDAFEQVQRHRAAEVAEAEQRLAWLVIEEEAAAAETGDLLTRLEESNAACEQARAARGAWERAMQRRVEAEACLSRAWAALGPVQDPLLGTADIDMPATDRGLPLADPEVMVAVVEHQVDTLVHHVTQQRSAAAAAQHLRGRLDRRQTAETALGAASRRAEAAERRRCALLEDVASLGFQPTDLDAARRSHSAAGVAADNAGKLAREALLAATRARTHAEAEARALAAARRQHAKLAELEGDARHLARVADLLSEFRNTVVASVGPRLALQAAELFGELTDHEYDELQVDPETYELQISDAGRTYGLDRFSGSEIDLANLAMRVAISEHVRFQSGGTVGLLVLDEVFGPLDEDRKARMLLALERLRGRFRQVLVVTHDANIKEQLPNAVEVVKRPGRRATARLLNA